MKAFWKSITAILLAAVLALSLPLAASGDDDDDEKSESVESQTITTTDQQGGNNQNITQNVEVNVEVEVENKFGGENNAAPGGGQQPAIRKTETLLCFDDLTGKALASHDWVHVYAHPSIYSKILETLKNKGEKTLEILGKAENSSHQFWYKVKTPSGIIGYIQDKYLLLQDINIPCETENPCVTPSPCETTPKPCEKTEKPCEKTEKPCGDILPAGVTVEVTYVPEIVYVRVPQVTYVPKLIYVTPEPTQAPTT